MTDDRMVLARAVLLGADELAAVVDRIQRRVGRARKIDRAKAVLRSPDGSRDGQREQKGRQHLHRLSPVVNRRPQSGRTWRAAAIAGTNPALKGRTPAPRR